MKEETNDYKVWTQHIGGEYIQLDPKKMGKINPLDIHVDEQKEEMITDEMKNTFNKLFIEGHHMYQLAVGVGKEQLMSQAKHFQEEVEEKAKQAGYNLKDFLEYPRYLIEIDEKKEE